MRAGFVALPLLAAGLLATGTAHAEPPAFRALPSGHVSQQPTTKAPSFIGAQEKVPGFFTATPKFDKDTPGRARYLSVVTDAKRAAAIHSEEGDNSENIDEGICLAEGRFSGTSGGEEEDPEARDWTPQLMREVNLWPKSKDNPEAGIGSVHSEQLVTKDGKVSLESVDAWVDPASRGVRLIGRASLPLVQVGAAIGGVKIYAGRDDRAGKTTTSFVQLVVTRPATARATRAGTLMAMRQDGTMAQGNGCGHLRIPIIVGSKVADSVVVLAAVELGSTVTAPAAEEEEKDKEKDKAGALGDVTEDTKNAKKPRFKKRHVSPAPAPGGESSRMVERETRTREMQISLSVSQTKADQEPVLAVSYGWANRETVQRTMEAEDGR